MKTREHHPAHVRKVIRKESSGMLFRWGQFRSAAGLDLDWKIECDALTDEDWQCIAAVGAQRLPAFGGVAGVPTGGLALAKAFEPYRVAGMHRMLVVDDVWTTGKSMRAFVAGEKLGEWWGFVAFARGATPRNVLSFAKIDLW